MNKEKIKVLYIAGYQRSGSTILQNVLGELDGFFAVGELRSLWEKDSLFRPCGCGKEFMHCSTWQEILHTSFGENPEIFIQEMGSYYQKVRTRNIYKLFLPGHKQRLISQLGPFLKALEKLYQSIQHTTGCKVIVDSSKTSMYASILSLIPSIDVYVLHLVRDSRGTQYSLLKRKENNHLGLQSHTALKGSLAWNLTNLVSEKAINIPKEKYFRLNYESFVKQPESSIKRILKQINEDTSEMPILGTHTIRLGTHHTLRGSPHRFDKGTITLSLDNQWQKKMLPKDKRTTTFFTFPLLVNYGYSESVPPILQYLWQLISVGVLIFTRGIGSLLGFLLNIVLGNALGASGTGIFYLFSSWTRVLGTVGSLGLPIYTLRTVSVMEGERKSKTAKQFVFIAILIASVTGLAITVLVNAITPLLAQFFLESPELSYILRFAAPAGILFILLDILTNALIGRGQANLAIMLKTNLIPAGMIGLLLLGVYTNPPLSAQFALWGYLLISLIAVLISLWKWFGRDISFISITRFKELINLFRFKNISAFWMLKIFQVFFNNLPILLLPNFASPAEIGLFGVAQRFVTMSVTILEALTSIFAPRFAHHYAQKEIKSLSRDLFLSQLYSILIYLPFVIIFIFFAVPLLAIVGDEFIDARNLLWIMTFGQLINASTGLSGIMLSMINQEKSVLSINIVSMFIMFFTILWLGSSYGVAGVAWGYSITTMIKFVILYINARRSIGLMKTNPSTSV